MASDENQPTTISAALSIIDAVKRERDEAREEGQDWNTQRQKLLLEKYELKALCREAADKLESEHEALNGERAWPGCCVTMEEECEICNLIKRMRKAGGE